MWGKGGDKWAYFGVENGDIAPFVKDARAELLAQGYAEDTKSKPWFRFVKGGIQVVVCYHDQFAVEGDNLVHSTVRGARGRPPSDFICVLVKNGPGTEMSFPVFKAKKLVHGW